ncbi:MAG: histidine kinase dimerization/phospho-acceptor domain-containing protein [Rhodothermales bacterium]
MDEPGIFGADTLVILAPARDAARYVAVCEHAHLAKTTVTVRDLDALSALFSQRAVDAVLVDARMPGADLDNLDALGEAFWMDTDVVALSDEPSGPQLEGGIERLTVVPAVAGAAVADDTVRIHLESVLYRRILRRLGLMVRREYEQAQLLTQTRKGLSSFYHDINNPLSILSGNAQLLIEIGRQMQLDEDLMAPLRDVEESSRRLHTDLQRIVRMKETIANSGLELSAKSADTP